MISGNVIITLFVIKIIINVRILHFIEVAKSS